MKEIFEKFCLIGIRFWNGVDWIFKKIGAESQRQCYMRIGMFEPIVGIISSSNKSSSRNRYTADLQCNSKQSQNGSVNWRQSLTDWNAVHCSCKCELVFPTNRQTLKFPWTRAESSLFTTINSALSCRTMHNCQDHNQCVAIIAPMLADRI